MASYDTHVALKDANSVASAIFESSTSPGVILRGQIDEITGRILVDSSGGGGVGTQYVVQGTINGVNTTFTIPVAVTGDFLLFYSQQPQLKYDSGTGWGQYTYSVGTGTTTITYQSGQQPFNGAAGHFAFVIS